MKLSKFIIPFFILSCSFLGESAAIDITVYNNTSNVIIAEIKYVKEDYMKYEIKPGESYKDGTYATEKKKPSEAFDYIIVTDKSTGAVILDLRGGDLDNTLTVEHEDETYIHYKLVVQ